MSRLLTHAKAPAAGGKPQAAARLAELLARLFRDAPDAEMMAGIATFDTTALDRPLADAVRRVSAAAALCEGDACRREYARLFFDPRGAAVMQWESTWTDDPPRLMGRSHLDAIRWYRRAGFRPRHDGEPADSIALELGFVALMISRGEIETLEEFWRAHVINWMPHLARRLREVTRAPFYAAVADLLETAIRPIRRTTHGREAAKTAARVR